MTCKLSKLIKFDKSWGREMSEFIWYWTKGERRIYTRNMEIAEKALKDGMLVMGMRVKPSIQKFR